MPQPLAVDPQAEMHRVLDRPPTPVRLTRGDATATVTSAWSHGALHDRTAPMTDHVFMTYLGAARPIERRSGRSTVRSQTRRGSVTLIPAGSEAEWHIAGEISVVHFYVSPARLRHFADRNDVVTGPDLVERTGFADDVGSRLLLMLAEAATGPTRADSLFADQAAELMCAHLLRAHSPFGLPLPTPAKGGLAPWQVRRITDYLDSHLAEEVTLAEIGKLLDLSPWHVCRAFKQSTGLPPHRWRAARRIARARDLLENTDLPLIEIALSVGYDGASQFSAAFRAATGLPPSEYRAMRRR